MRRWRGGMTRANDQDRAPFSTGIRVTPEPHANLIVLFARAKHLGTGWHFDILHLNKFECCFPDGEIHLLPLHVSPVTRSTTRPSMVRLRGSSCPPAIGERDTWMPRCLS